MQFDAPRKPRAGQDRAIVPMINVVFLLLVFFLMTASLTPPDPFEITAPVAGADPIERQPDTLYIAADGRLAFNDIEGNAAFQAIGSALPEGPLPILADSALPAAELAGLMARLASVGVTDVDLLTVLP